MIPNNGYNNIVGIYCISNNTTGQMYIGKSIDINRRWYNHCKHPSEYSRIDLAIQKHGIYNFSLSILTVAPNDPELLSWLERNYIKSYNTYHDNFHYNLTPGGESLVDKENPRYRHDLPTADELYEEWQSGTPITKLKEKYNCGDATIKRRLRKLPYKKDGRFNHNIPSNDILFNEWQSGTTQKELAEKYNCSVSQIECRMRKYKKEHNITNPKQNKSGIRNGHYNSAVPTGVELIKERNANKLTYKQLATKYNCSESLINHRIRNARGTIVRPNYSGVPSGKDLLNEFENSDCTQRELAQKYNCSIYCIKGRIRYARNKSKSEPVKTNH